MKTALIALSIVAAASATAQAKPSAGANAALAAISGRLSAQSDIWFHDGEFPTIAQALRFSNRLNPREGEIAENLGWMLENIEEDGEALATYIRYGKENPQDPDRHYMEAYFYFQKRVFAKVPPLLEPAVREGKASPNTYRTLAHSHERMNQFADSKRVWEAFMKRFPNDGAGPNNLRRVTEKLEKQRAAGANRTPKPSK